MTTNVQTHTQDDLARLLADDGAAGWRRRMAVWAAVAAAILGVGLSVRYLTAVSPASAGPAYVTEPVARGSLHVRVAATGTLRPTNTVDVGSELSGLVDAVFVDDNSHVKKGQVLAQLDTSKLQDQIRRSEASLTAAEAQLAVTVATVKEATASLERLREVFALSDGKVPSKAEMDTGEATFARADAGRQNAAATVTEARATLSTDRTNLAKASIRSPIDGIVLKRTVEPGQTVAASLQVATLFQIAEDLKQMELEVDVDEADVGRVRDGQSATFTVDAWPGRDYSANVTRVAYGATTTADVVSYATVLVVDNDDLSLRPGMTASADIATASVDDALLVPNGALRFTPAAATTTRSRGFVGSLLPGPSRGQAAKPAEAAATDGSRKLWVLRDGTPHAVPVTTGVTDGRQTVILSGDLKPGDAVITDAGTGAAS